MFTKIRRSGVLGSAGFLVLASLLVWKAKPLLRAIRAAAEWIDYSPTAPLVILAVAAACIAALCLWRRVAPPPSKPIHVLHIANRSTTLWEGQETLCVSGPSTAKIRFVLHSRKKAG